MSREEVSRRDFHRLSAAALCGLIAGTTLGCAQEGPEHAPKNAGSVDASPAHATTTTTTSSTSTASGKVAVTAVALHACRGLNECKGLGKSADNACAGQGHCYTVKHDCAGQNDCKYQGGCGGENGMNDCKTKGGCGHFPIAEADVWKKARAAFETRLKTANKKFGPAPAAKS